jgi:Beta propeller domain
MGVSIGKRAMRSLWLTLVCVPALLGGGAVAAAADQGTSGLRLTRMASCSDLAAYGLDHALPLVGPYGLWEDAGRRPIRPRAAQFRTTPQGRDFSTTNVQEEGVDEPDVVKTDGDRLFAVASSTVRVLTARGRLRQLNAIPFPRDQELELLLHDDRLVVLARGGTRPSWLPGGFRRPTQYAAHVTLTEIDVSRPARPSVTRTITLSGSYITARMVGGVIRVVTVASVPARVAFVRPTAYGEAAYAVARERNRALLAAAPAEDWLPTAVFVDVRRGKIEHRPLVECRHVWRPAQFSGLGLTTVTTIGVEGGLHLRDADAIFSDAEIVYASGDSLFVATERWRDRPDPNVWPRRPSGDARTILHKFGIGGPVTRYRGTGAVKGYLMNQWSLSEHDGVMRVASTERPTWWEPGPDDRRQSFVTALVEKGGKLVPVGRVGGLGRGERVYAVRFVGNMGYVVTFRQTDPLYTVDLSRPARPAVRGALEVEGYSAYLHPVGPDLMLGVGRAFGNVGQLSLFDLSDAAKPKRLFNRLLGAGSASSVESDHRAFLYWPPERLVVVPAGLRDRFGWFSAAAAYRLERNRIEPLARITHGEAQMLRSVVVGDSLFTISTGGVKKNGLGAFAVRGWVPFEDEL